MKTFWQMLKDTFWSVLADGKRFNLSNLGEVILHKSYP